MKIKASGQYFQRLVQENKCSAVIAFAAAAVIAFAAAFARLNVSCRTDGNHRSHHSSFPLFYENVVL